MCIFILISCIDERTASLHKSNRVRSASVVTATPTKTTTCCNCFGPLKSNQWDDVISNQMSDVYCRVCDDDVDEHEYVRIPKDRLNSPAILTNVTNKRCQRNQSSQIKAKTLQIKLIENSLKKSNESIENAKNNEQIVDKITKNQANFTEDYELGDDVMVTNDDLCSSKSHSLKCIPDDLIRVRGKEELPATSNEQLCHNINDKKSNDNKCPNFTLNKTSKEIPNKIICTNNHPLMPNAKCMQSEDKKPINSQKSIDDCNGNQSMTKSVINPSIHRQYSTLPRIKKSTVHQDTTLRSHISIPTRTTNDGTNIYYICDIDISKNNTKGGTSISLSYFHKFSFIF